MEARKDEFRQYLEDTGVISALTKALIKLYEMKYNRPESAVEFIQKNMADDYPSMEQYQNLLNELNEKKAILAEFKKTAAVTSEQPDESKEKAADATAAKNANNDPIEDAKKLLEALHADANCNSLLKKHLTMDLFEKLKDKKTKLGKTLIDCINSGLRHPKSSIGVYAADADAYTVFEELFNPIINEYHNYDTNSQTHTIAKWEEDCSQFQDLGPSIKSTRIRCARSLKDFPLNTAMTEEDYVKSMEKVKIVLENLTGNLEGTFHELEGMDEKVQKEKIENHLLFKPDDENLKDAGALQFWPKGRAIFESKNKKFLVWVNEEDHLRFISMVQSEDIKESYTILREAIIECEKHLEFKTDTKLGFITFCPTNLGSTIRASVMIELPKLDETTLKQLVETNKLQIRGEHGEGSTAANGVYEISYKERLGLSEHEAVKRMCDGIKLIIEEEDKLASPAPAPEP